MSSQNGSELLRLAPELVENVIKQVNDRRELSNIRLTCKTLDKHAANELFKDVFVSPEEQHMTSWNSVSQDDVPDIEDHGLGMSRERHEVDEDDDELSSFDDAIAALSKFPNLTSVEIGFTPECMGRDAEYWQDVPEDASQREEVLTRIFQAIKDRAADEKNRKIRKLTIINLQNCPIPDLTSSELFRDVMAQMEELHISLVQEYNEHGPDHDYTKVELQTFPAYFCSHWLKPISGNLKALSIYSQSENWGPFPGYFDFSAITFPKLEKLALGYYTLAHDNDLDWILAIKSLRKLTLHNCMIASWIRISKENISEWKFPKHDWTKMPEEEEDSWCENFAYGGKWNQHFDRIANELPNLVDFRFGFGSSYRGPPYGVAHRDTCGVEVNPRRYVCFDNGILPTHWPEAEEDGDMHSWLDDGFPVNKHRENLKADKESLDALLDALRSRS
ncbi:hypothetical protein FB567DRAFT_457036 [Paraphoma chrysanthemicola]|uniref:F-box domain-containing protein n=1 Tax=Paraphoma chrysanthemicola TaxID=798071 RepID=A0A8K0VRR9_9PLEO|nr:hypothetical protein FB567DRAFT_457036 [Paraphoma chrysanthemicola]